MQNARSILGRFSGLALFLVALVIVGLLVIFTVRSTNDDEGTVTTDDGNVATETAEQSGPVDIPDLDSEPQVTDNSAVGNTTESDEQGTVAGTEDGLPNTGPEEAIIPAAIIGLLVWQLLKWRESRHRLSGALNG